MASIAVKSYKYQQEIVFRPVSNSFPLPLLKNILQAGLMYKGTRCSEEKFIVANSLVREYHYLFIFWYPWHIFAKDVGKISSQYFELNLNCELDMTRKSNLALR